MDEKYDMKKYILFIAAILMLCSSVARADESDDINEAFKKGNMGVMDYYKMKNIVADTQMRDTIGSPEDKKD